VDALPLRDVLSVVADPLPEDPDLSARSFVLVAAGDAHMRGAACVEGRVSRKLALSREPLDARRGNTLGNASF